MADEEISNTHPEGSSAIDNEQENSETSGAIGNLPAGRQGEQQPEIKDMEVHQHSHTHGSDSYRNDSHRKRSWKSYFWEFLMLFLAVFCGFLAEYQLEHKIEKDREKQFIRSLVNDITRDTARVNSIIDARNLREIRLDSLTFLLNNRASNTNDIYFYGSLPTRRINIRFVPNDGTLQQLKNSGGLRLIRNRQVVDSISGYDVTIRNLVTQVEVEAKYIDNYSQSSEKIFDALVFETMVDENNRLKRPTENPPLATFSQADLREFNSRLYMVKSMNRSARREEKLFLRQAENLLTLLKKKYNIK